MTSHGFAGERDDPPIFLKSKRGVDIGISNRKRKESKDFLLLSR